MSYQKNKPQYRYKKPEAQNGDLRTPLTFYTSKVEEGLHDPLSDYQPKNEHFVEVGDSRLSGEKWQIIDVRPDFDNRDFLIVIIGGGQDV